MPVTNYHTELGKLLEALADDKLQQLESKTGVDLSDVGRKLRLMREIAEGASAQDELLVPKVARGLLTTDPARIQMSLRAILNYDPNAAARAPAGRTPLTDAEKAIGDILDSWIAQIRPHLQLGEQQAANTIAAFERRLKAAETAASAAVVARTFTSHYSDAARDEAKSARRFLIATVALLLMLTAATFVVFGPPLSIAGISVGHPFTSDPAQAIRETAAALAALGVLFYALRFTASNYRAHRHMETSNRGRVAALSTFPDLLNMATDKEAKNILIATLGRATFDPGTTGLVAGQPHEDSGIDIVSLVRAMSKS